jgi:phosphate transport system substrate-binding protein
VLAGLATALTACSSAPPATGTPAAAVTASGAAATAIRLAGAGSTFDAPFFDLAFPRYQQQHPGVVISYAAVGSSAGITAFTAASCPVAAGGGSGTVTTADSGTPPVLAVTRSGGRA